VPRNPPKSEIPASAKIKLKATRRHFLGMGAAGLAAAGGLVGTASMPVSAATETGLSFYPQTGRVYDSRTEDGPLSSGQYRTLDLSTVIVPNTASVVLLNVTITNTEGQGYIALAPGLPSVYTPGSYSNINWWDSDLTLANTATVLLGGAPVGSEPTVITINCEGAGKTRYNRNLWMRELSGDAAYLPV
jgi:hypothetical protein